MTLHFDGHIYFLLYKRGLGQEGEMSGPLEAQVCGHGGCWQRNIPGVKGLMGLFISKF